LVGHGSAQGHELMVRRLSSGHHSRPSTHATATLAPLALAPAAY
jgi:hypothetical protein